MPYPWPIKISENLQYAGRNVFRKIFNLVWRPLVACSSSASSDQLQTKPTIVSFGYTNLNIDYAKQKWMASYNVMYAFDSPRR